MMIQFHRVTSHNQQFLDLVKLLDAELHLRYGEVQEQFVHFNKIEFISTVVIASENDQPVACGCFKTFDVKTVEIKRLFVKPEFRGRGIAGKILDQLEAWAKQMGYERSVLETGIRQPEAIKVYLTKGYRRIENYEPYVGNGYSVCMEKLLTIF